MHIRMVGAKELGVLRDIERAAGQSFHELGMAEIAEDEPLPVAELAGYQRAGRAWAFPEVPWNAPYCRPCGFRVQGEDELTPGLRAIGEREAAHGLDRWPRVCMRREL